MSWCNNYGCFMYGGDFSRVVLSLTCVSLLRTFWTGFLHSKRLNQSCSRISVSILSVSISNRVSWGDTKRVGLNEECECIYSSKAMSPLFKIARQIMFNCFVMFFWKGENRTWIFSRLLDSIVYVGCERPTVTISRAGINQLELAPTFDLAIANIHLRARIVRINIATLCWLTFVSFIKVPTPSCPYF